MKTTRKLLAAFLAAILLCGTVFAATGFNAKLTVDRSVDGVITVGVENSSILESEKPTLSIPCDFAAAKVTGPDGELECTVTDGQVSFTVAKGGTYTITEVELPPEEDDNEDDSGTVTPPPYNPPVVPPTAPSEEEKDEGPAVENPFTDLKEESYYYDAVLWAVEKGITSGATTTTFAPEDPCTRGQMMAFLWRAAGCPEPKATDCKFTDVDLDSYYGKAVLWAIENGITSGTSTTTFGPGDECTRGQMAAFLMRMAGGKAEGKNTKFIDVDADSYYAEAVQWVLENGITSGMTVNQYGPNSVCTRAQMVSFLYRFFEN